MPYFIVNYELVLWDSFFIGFKDKFFYPVVDGCRFDFEYVLNVFMSD